MASNWVYFDLDNRGNAAHSQGSGGFSQSLGIPSSKNNSLAYEELIDGLLIDPARFGERMAVHWLDLVRYSDTIGYHSDNFMEVSAYRDYVIEAFNENLPYDQFVIENLAGDLVPAFKPPIGKRLLPAITACCRPLRISS